MDFLTSRLNPPGEDRRDAQRLDSPIKGGLSAPKTFGTER